MKSPVDIYSIPDEQWFKENIKRVRAAPVLMGDSALFDESVGVLWVPSYYAESVAKRLGVPFGPESEDSEDE